MPTHFKFNRKSIDLIAVIFKIYLYLKRSDHRIILFSVARNKFLLLFVYQRVIGEIENQPQR